MSVETDRNGALYQLRGVEREFRVGVGRFARSPGSIST
jgi:hypothetical protein